VKALRFALFLACSVLWLAVGCSSADSPSDQPTPLLRVVSPDDPFPVGSTGSYILLAHCGVEFAIIDGDTWRTRRRDDGQGNPPAGWPDEVEGRLTRPSDDRAVFESEAIPEVLVFEPTSQPFPGCA